MWHSLDENGKIEIYDVQWADGTVETNIPVAMLEGVQITEHGNTKKEGAHGVQEKDTPVNERNYKGKMMKISKNQLRRIIKEEKQKILAEANYRHPKTGENMFLMLNDIVDKLLDAGMDTGELAAELRGLADDVEDSAPSDDFMDVEGFRSEMSRRSR